jgi:hypothetical protein
MQSYAFDIPVLLFYTYSTYSCLETRPAVMCLCVMNCYPPPPPPPLVLSYSGHCIYMSTQYINFLSLSADSFPGRLLVTAIFSYLSYLISIVGKLNYRSLSLSGPAVVYPYLDHIVFISYVISSFTAYVRIFRYISLPYICTPLPPPKFL